MPDCTANGLPVWEHKAGRQGLSHKQSIQVNRLEILVRRCYLYCGTNGWPSSLLAIVCFRALQACMSVARILDFGWLGRQRERLQVCKRLAGAYPPSHTHTHTHTHTQPQPHPPTPPLTHPPRPAPALPPALPRPRCLSVSRITCM